MIDELAAVDATEQARMVRDGEVTALELVDAAIARIEALDPQLNAVIHTMFDKARASAADPDLPDGPFRGVPFLVKDLWQPTAGDPLHSGVKGCKEAGYVHPTDSNLVTRYRQAGFVMTGRTNTPELGLVATTEPLAYGPTHNPWNPEYGPGGSSGGAAAAVASGMVPAANASDGGGSIRIPAAMCGLVGLKPSRGRVSNGPLIDDWGLSCQHVVTRTTRDSAGILDATSIHFHGDGVIAPGPDRPYADLVEVDPPPLRIGLQTTDTRTAVDADCAAAAEETARLLETMGHRVEEAHPPSLDRGDENASNFLSVWATNSSNSLRALGALIGRELGEDDVEPGTWIMATIGDNTSGPDLAAAWGSMHAFRRETAQWWAEGWDLLLTPTTSAPPPELGRLVPSDDDPLQGSRLSAPYANYTSPFNITGQPAISMPVHLTADGLPVGAQLVADYARDDLCLQVSAQLERELGWAARRAPIHG